MPHLCGGFDSHTVTEAERKAVRQYFTISIVGFFIITFLSIIVTNFYRTIQDVPKK